MGRAAEVLHILSALVAWTVVAPFIAAAVVPAGALALWLWPLTPAGLWGLFVKGLVGWLAFLTFGLSLLAAIAFFLQVVRIRLKPGLYGLRSWTMMGFYVQGALNFLSRLLFLNFIRGLPIMNFYYRGMGAKVGKRAIINTTHFHDPSLMEVGEYAVIGGSSVILGHVGVGKRLHLGKVIIGPKASIGERAILFPDVVVGEKAVVAANSVVKSGTRIPPGEVWGGVPARPVRSDAAAQAQEDH